LPLLLLLLLLELECNLRVIVQRCPKGPIRCTIKFHCNHSFCCQESYLLASTCLPSKKKPNKPKLLLLLLDTTTTDHSLLLPQLLPPQLLLPGTNFAYCWCNSFCILLPPAQDCSPLSTRTRTRDQVLPNPSGPQVTFWAVLLLLPALIPNPIVIVRTTISTVIPAKAQQVLPLPRDPLVLVAQGPLDQQQVLALNPLVGH
jgi:hypothetical protein